VERRVERAVKRTRVTMNSHSQASAMGGSVSPATTASTS